MKWTVKQKERLSRMYPDMLTEKIAAMIGRSLSSVRNQAFLMGLKKSAAFNASIESGRLHKLTSAGSVHRFGKGHRTWNKGMKGLDIGGKQTRFKAGRKPQTWKPIGAERTDKDGVRWRKITDTGSKKDWRQVHVMAWEAVHGPLPADHVVVFFDKNKANISSSNLLAVTRPQLMSMNTIHRYPPELKRAMKLLKKVQRQIHEEQD